MPKIQGGLADISTAVRIAPEASYTVKIASVDFKAGTNGKSPMYVIVTRIEEPDNADVNGILIYENITTELKDGKGRNEAGLRRFKRIIEQTLGEDRANDEEFDTDELVGWTGTAMVTQEPYTDKGGEEQISNRIKKYIA